MPSIQDFPVEVWLCVFEYLDIPTLYTFNTVFGVTLSSVIAQAARKVVRNFLVSTKPTIDSYLVCPGFRFIDTETLPKPTDVQICLLFFRRCYSRIFQRNNSASKMTIQFACRRRCIHNDLIFYPCLNGSEPAELISLNADFYSNEKLADGSVERLRLMYRTERQNIPVRANHEVHNDDLTTTTLSHQMPLCQFQWQTSNMQYNHGVDLPLEWVNFLNDNIEVLMRFERNCARKHVSRRCPDVQCLPYRLLYFEADWTFDRIYSQLSFSDLKL